MGHVSGLTLLAADRSQWWIFPSMVLTIFFAAIMPAFYFALYLDRKIMQFPTYLRKVAIAAALTCGIVTAWRLEASPDPLSWRTIPGLIPNCTYMLLLLSISRDAPATG